MNASLRVLVTGATGFIGGHLARCLAAQGHHVRALVRREAPDLVAPGIELVRGSLTDTGAVWSAMQGADAVFHLAAVRDTWGTPAAAYQQVNVEATQSLLGIAAECGVRRFVHCSSVGVARYPGNLQADEALPYSKPTSQVLYHRTKAEAERAALDAGAVVVRPVITYGPGDESGFVTRMITLLAQGRYMGIGNGLNHVDLVYIDDLVAGMTLALEQGAGGQVYILSGTAPIQVRTLVNVICSLLDRTPPPLSIPTAVARAAGWGMEMVWRGAGLVGLGRGAPFVTRDKVATLTVDRGFSHKRASLALGYCPQIDYGQGLRLTLDWLATRPGFPRR